VAPVPRAGHQSTIDRLGYDTGLNVFLIGAQDNGANGTSTLTVIRRL
jgi:hypothetical protein